MISISGIIDVNASVVNKSLNTLVINITFFVLLYIVNPLPLNRFGIERTNKTTITIKVFNTIDVARTPKTSKMESFVTKVNS